MPASIPFDNTYARLPEHFYSRQNPAEVPQPRLVKLNGPLARELGIDPIWLESEQGLAMLAGNKVPVGAEPLAQGYAGHQFGGFVPQLGDGRAILLGEVINTEGMRRDIQLKGSGRTPFSRGGDGKAALGPVLREYILSEAMHALGVPTTRALAAVTTGEMVVRQEGKLSGAIFTRVAASHLRVGTFQYFAARRDTESIRQLADYAIRRHYPECLGTTAQPSSAAPYPAFFKAVIHTQARLIAQWMSLGFIHGVMNTDNSSISGETIDYGPCAFMDVFHPDCVFSSIDVNGRYAWGNQPNIAHWNLTRLAETLLPLFDEDSEKATQLAEMALAEFSPYFSDQYMFRFRSKFGFTTADHDEILQDGLSLLANQQVDFTLFFQLLTRIAEGNSTDSLTQLFNDTSLFENWFKQWCGAIDNTHTPMIMREANPVLIPRNHRVEQAIQSAYSGDYEPFHRLVEALQAPFTENEAFADLEQQPLPDELVHETFCGT